MAGAIDAGVILALGADAELAALMPDGVWMNAAPPDASRFVTVAVFDSFTVDEFGGWAIKETLYAVKAVGLASLAPDMAAAAARIEAVLGDADIAIAGYSFMASYADDPGRISYTETDRVDASIRWYHEGAHYRVEVTHV